MRGFINCNFFPHLENLICDFQAEDGEPNEMRIANGCAAIKI